MLQLGELMEKTYAAKYQAVWRYIHGGEILDIGARDASFLRYAPKTIYYSYESMDKVKNKFIKYAHDICKPFTSKKRYDYVLLLDVIEHLENPMQALQNIKKLLKKNGRLILTTPNALSYRRFLKSIIKRRIENPDHLFSFNRETISNLLGQAGYKIEKFEYLSWLPYLHTLSRESFLSELMLVVARPRPAQHKLN